MRGAAYPAAAGLFVIGLSVRDVYELLKRRDRIDTASTPVFAVVFTSMCVMWVSWFALGLLAPARLTIPSLLRWAGMSAVLTGVVLAVGGMWQLGGVENIDHLVTTGVFSKIRHPMYVGFALWIVGWCAYTGTVANLLLAPFGIASVAWWRRLEESQLAAQYGSEYADYRATSWL